jgi:hypothetical protein
MRCCGDVVIRRLRGSKPERNGNRRGLPSGRMSCAAVRHGEFGKDSTRAARLISESRNAHPVAAHPFHVRSAEWPAMSKKTPKKCGANLPSELRAPIYVEVTTGLGLWQTKPLTKIEIIKQASKLTNQRLEVLMRHYRISPSSSNKWQRLSFHLAKELGLMDITFEKPRSRKKFGQLKAGGTLIERMDKLRAKYPDLESLAVAAIVRRKYLDDYKDLTPKSLVNRYGEAKQRFGMRLSASLAECRAVVGQQLRQQRAKRKSQTGSNIPSRYEKYLADFLRRLRAIAT